MQGNSTKDLSFSTWLRLLLQAVLRHGLALIFVIILLIVFRMPQLSDLTVVIIQLENNADFLVMAIFYATILVMAVLISYGDLLPIETDSDTDDQTHMAVAAEASEEPKPLRVLRNATKAINLKDSKERRLEQKKIALASVADVRLATDSDAFEHPESYIDRLYPKVLAIVMILGITFSVENTYYELFGELITFPYFFVLLTGVLIALTHPKLGAFIKRTLKWKWLQTWSPFIVVVFSIVVIIVLGMLNDGGTKSDIASLFWSMICLSMLFFVFSISYNTKVLCVKEKVAMPLAYIFTVLMVLMYLVMLFDPELHQLKELTPMVIIMICIIGQYTIFLGLTYLGKRIGWPLLTMVVSAAILLTIFVAKSDGFTHYEVSTVAAKNRHPDDRLGLEAYVDHYIAARRDAILAVKENEQFPIILVSAEGGGSRAGLWALLVHSYLYGKSEAYFKQHLFSITGASGGSVGSNMFYAQAYANKDSYDSELFLSNKSTNTTNEAQGKTDIDFEYKASQLYQNDFISSSVAGLLGRDIIASIFHLTFYKDRGEITETEWEREFDTLFDKGLLRRPYLNIMPQKGDAFIPPILVTTTTHVQTGQLYIMSPVKFNVRREQESGFNDLLSAYVKNNPDSEMIKRSAAMLLTARFPYLSPNGRISGVGQFGDGGYYDNVGGTVSKYLEAALRKGLAKDSLLDGKYKIKHLIIENDPSTTFELCPKAAKKEKEAVSYSSQLVTPAQMAVNAIFAHADEFINATSPAYRVASKRTLIPLHDTKRPSNGPSLPCDSLFRPLIPLGRYLSIDAVRSLEARLKAETEVKDRLDGLLDYE